MTAPAPAAIWASLPVPALVIGPDDRIAAVNPAAEDFLNLSERALLGQPVLERLSIDAPVEETLARLRAGHTLLSIHGAPVSSGERPPVVCDLQATQLEGAPGAVLLLVIPRELADQLGQGDRLGAASKSAIGMAEMLAHEIKNPLAGISGAAQLLAMTVTPEETEMTELIVEETRRIVKLLEQVEQFGNLLPPEKLPVNIHDVLERARKSATFGFGQHMRFITDFDPSLPSVPGDTDQLLQVMLNLLKNASEAAGAEGGTIRLRTYYDQGLRRRTPEGTSASLPLQVEITDDGPGIPPALVEHIFDPFVSGRDNGTGLGLALVAKIVADHDGWISVSSVPGRTVFRISLPVINPKGGRS